MPDLCDLESLTVDIKLKTSFFNMFKLLFNKLLYNNGHWARSEDIWMKNKNYRCVCCMKAPDIHYQSSVRHCHSRYQCPLVTVPSLATPDGHFDLKRVSLPDRNDQWSLHLSWPP